MPKRKSASHRRDIVAELVRSVEDMKAGRWSQHHEYSTGNTEIAARLCQLAAQILKGDYNAERFQATTQAAGSMKVVVELVKVA